MDPNVEEQKRRAAHAAADLVRSGMALGLGSGSTTAYALERLAQRLHNAEIENVCGVPSSRQTEQLAVGLGFPLSDLKRHPYLHLNIDGADEVDPDLNLIKGGGGALLREKVVAQASDYNVIIVHGAKLAPRLGTGWPVPLEVVPFALPSIERWLGTLGATVSLRRTSAGEVFRTDQDNRVIDANFGPIADPVALAFTLQARAGIAEHGLFIGIADEVIVAGEQDVKHLKRLK